MPLLPQWQWRLALSAQLAIRFFFSTHSSAAIHLSLSLLSLALLHICHAYSYAVYAPHSALPQNITIHLLLWPLIHLTQWLLNYNKESSEYLARPLLLCQYLLFIALSARLLHLNSDSNAQHSFTLQLEHWQYLIPQDWAANTNWRFVRVYSACLRLARNAILAPQCLAQQCQFFFIAVAIYSITVAHVGFAKYCVYAAISKDAVLDIARRYIAYDLCLA